MPEEPDRLPDPAGRTRDSGRGDWTRALREAAQYLGIGSSSAASVALGLVFGYWLDERLGTRPALFLLGGVAGILAAFWQVYKLVMGRKP